MSEEIFNKVKEQAEKNKRSVAKEIEYLLERHFEDHKKPEGKT